MEQGTVPIDVEKVAERLKATRSEEEADARRSGYEAGFEWAKESATLAELEGVALDLGGVEEGGWNPVAEDWLAEYFEELEIPSRWREPGQPLPRGLHRWRERSTRRSSRTCR